VVLAAIENDVRVAVLLSSDKACAPLNLYGATKMVAEKLFIQGNHYAGEWGTNLCAVRYGNVVGSRGSVIPIFQRQAREGMLTITHPDMTRFWITLPQAVEFVLGALAYTGGWEISVPKLPAMRIVDLAEAIAPGVPVSFTGIRPGEKLHELLIAPGEAYRTYEEEDRFIILPDEIKGKGTLTEREQYSSQDPDHWLSPAELRGMV
jgi:UDP-N-acetylglucosamine 4,6-dehydratase